MSNKAGKRRVFKREFRLFFKENQWMLIGIAWIITFALAWIGADKQLRLTGMSRSFWDPFYRAFQLFLFDDSMVASGPILSWELEIARFFAPAVAAYTAFSALLNLVNDRILHSVRLRRLRKHVVVCGPGRKGLELIRDFKKNGIRVVAIESDPNNENIAICKDLDAVVIIGDAADPHVLERARVHHAEMVVAITGNDGTNVEIAVRTHHLVKSLRDKSSDPLKCYVQVSDTKLRLLFGRHPVFTDVKDPFEITVFNTYLNSARLLFERFPLDGQGISKDDPTEVHLIIIGFGQMGESILLQAVKTSHFANRKKLQATVVEIMAKKKSRIFRDHYPQINQLCAVEFLEYDAEDPDLLDIITGICQREGTKATIVIALDNDAHALSCALGFLLRLETIGISMIVRMSEETGLAVLLKSEAASSGWMSSIQPFGMTGDTCNLRMLRDDLLDKYARRIHEDYVNRRLIENPGSKELNLAKWDKLNPDFKDSNRQQADHIPVKLRAIGCRIAGAKDEAEGLQVFTTGEIELLAMMEHDRWVAERMIAGWTPGPKDPTRKKSPYLVAWEELSESIREYDRESVRNIPSILAMADKKIIRMIKN